MPDEPPISPIEEIPTPPESISEQPSDSQTPQPALDEPLAKESEPKPTQEQAKPVLAESPRNSMQDLKASAEQAVQDN